MSDSAFFVAGGTVPPGSASYVERAADVELAEALRAGEFCYVLNSRQMGKSSLAVRTIARLAEAGVGTAFVDLTRLGATGADPERWYASLLLELGRALGLRAEAMATLKGTQGLTPSARLFGFLSDEVLPRSETPLVVFIDEVDATRSLPFSADDLFAGIRQAWNARAEDPRYRRLTFCLMGAALPSDLIRDPRITPFNVGRRVELRDFTPQEAAPFASGLLPFGGGQGGGSAADQTLARVLHWTGGHPYLTQALSAALAQTPTLPSPRGEGSTVVDNLVRARYLDGRARESDTNLADVGNRLLGTGDPEMTDERRAETLSLYERMLRGKAVLDDETNPAAARIKMSGVARVEGGNLRVRNRLYARAFDATWVREAMPGGELRRQRQAFWRGALRTGLVSSLVVGGMGALAFVAVANERKARAAETEAVAQRGIAQGNAKEAADQRDEARSARDAEAKGAVLLRKALKEQRRLGKAATDAAAQATAAAHIADEQRGVAQRRATEARRSATLARQSAAETTRQRGNAQAQTRLVLAGRRTLEAELYETTIQTLASLWERGDRAEMARTFAAAPVGPKRGWEWDFWQRLAQIGFTEKLPFTGGSTVSLVGLIEGDAVVAYSGFDGGAALLDAKTGRTRRVLWRLSRRDPNRPIRSFGAGFSRNGHWAVYEDGKVGLLRQDVRSGAIRTLPRTTERPIPGGVTDDGSRYVTRIFGGEGKPSKLTLWDVPSECALVVRELPAALSLPRELTSEGRVFATFNGSDTIGIAEYDIEGDAIAALYALPIAETGGSQLVGLASATAEEVVVRIGEKVAAFRRGVATPHVVLSSSILRGGRTLPMRLSTSGNGSRLLVSSRFGTVNATSELWDLRTGRSLGSVPLSNAIISPNGTTVLAANGGEIRGNSFDALLPFR